MTTNNYLNTPCSTEESKRDIEKMLTRYGCLEIFWTERELYFMMSYKYNNTISKLKAQMQIPNGKTKEQAYRKLFYNIKAKLLSIDDGSSSMQREFLSDIILKIENNRAVTVFEIMQSKLMALP